MRMRLKLLRQIFQVLLHPFVPSLRYDGRMTPSQAQYDFIRSLVGTRTLDATLTERVEHDRALATQGQLTREQASELIALLKDAPVVSLEGMHQLPNGDIYKVQVAHSGSGNLYAKRLVVTDGDASFEYERGALRLLSASTRMTTAAAAAFGSLYGICCNCGRTLTDETSIARGIGPVCEQYFI
jgi:hypothetical protein